MKDRNGIDVEVGQRAVVVSGHDNINGCIGEVKDVAMFPPQTLGKYKSEMCARVEHGDFQGNQRHWSAWCRGKEITVVQ